MYNFPKDLYSDIRIERSSDAYYSVKNGEVQSDSEISVTGAIIRVYDGELWYTSVTNDIENIQAELDNLAAIAKPKNDIYEDPTVKNFEVNKAEVLKYEGENDVRKITRAQRKALVDGYISACVDESISEVKTYYATCMTWHRIKEFYSSKGAEIVQDFQNCTCGLSYSISVDGVTTNASKFYRTLSFDELKGHEAEIIAERDRYIDYAKNNVPVEGGDYVCVLAPVVTAMFTHESFGHKSEADFMLNDETLKAEWVMGKKVGSDLVSICDSGDMPNNGYVPYDDEGSKARPTWLIKNGVLTGRLHDANSAAALGEEITGNARAQSYAHSPMVRMTNTYMQGGETPPEDIIAGVKDGIYVYSVNYGTGNSTFTMQPSLCYRIRDGKLCEPVKANVITGSVFKTLFDIDALGSDYELFNTFTCGKNGQSVYVSAGGPTIRVRSLNVN